MPSPFDFLDDEKILAEYKIDVKTRLKIVSLYAGIVCGVLLVLFLAFAVREQLAPALYYIVFGILAFSFAVSVIAAAISAKKMKFVVTTRQVYTDVGNMVYWEEYEKMDKAIAEKVDKNGVGSLGFMSRSGSKKILAVGVIDVEDACEIMNEALEAYKAKAD